MTLTMTHEEFNTPVDGEFYCKRCGDLKPKYAFRPDRNAKRRLNERCGPCRTARANAYKYGLPQEPDTIVKRALTPLETRIVRTGATVAWAEQTYHDQEGLCAICKEPMSWTSTGKNSETWCIDHDHVTGAFRGLLCLNCNHGLGKFKDDPNVIKAAQNYLLSHSQPKG